MALIERLMGLKADGSPIASSEDHALKISVHTFGGYVSEVIQNAQNGGGVTAAEMKSALEMSNTVDASGRSDVGDMNALAATFPGTLAGRALMATRVHGVLLLAESKAPGYSTPAEVRAKLGI